MVAVTQHTSAFRMQSLPPIHPAAAIIPAMSEAEYSELVADIAAHGQLEACVLHQGQLLDGRHRWSACEQLGLGPKTRTWQGECGSPTAFVISMNVKRRHLSESQLGMVGADAEPLIAEELKEHQREAGRQRTTHAQRTKSGQLVAPVPQAGEPEQSVAPQPPAPKARDLAAKTVGVSGRTVGAAKRIKKADPKLAEKVRSGEITLKAAEKQVARQEVQQTQAQLDRLADKEGKLARQKLRTAYFSAIKVLVSDLLPLRPEALAETFGEADWRQLDQDAARLTAWFSALAAAKPSGLRVVRNEHAD